MSRVSFHHSPEIRADYPSLAAGVLAVDGIRVDAAVDAAVDLGPFLDVARSRLSGTTEAQLPEIQAWRRVFASMGLKPTQYRCASEALLRRFRKEDQLPRLHPLVDLANAVSLAYAVPIAVIDLARIDGDL